MNKNKIIPPKQNKRFILILLFAAILLIIPLTAGANWTLFDFIVATFLLLSTGLMCELVIRKVNNKNYRIVICAVLLVALFLIWAELAVGILDTPFSGS